MVPVIQNTVAQVNAAAVARRPGVGRGERWAGSHSAGDGVRPGGDDASAPAVRALNAGVRWCAGDQHDGGGTVLTQKKTAQRGRGNQVTAFQDLNYSE